MCAGPVAVSYVEQQSSSVAVSTCQGVPPPGRRMAMRRCPPRSRQAGARDRGRARVTDGHGVAPAPTKRAPALRAAPPRRNPKRLIESHIAGSRRHQHRRVRGARRARESPGREVRRSPAVAPTIAASPAPPRRPTVARARRSDAACSDLKMQKRSRERTPRRRAANALTASRDRSSTIFRFSTAPRSTVAQEHEVRICSHSCGDRPRGRHAPAARQLVACRAERVRAIDGDPRDADAAKRCIARVPRSLRHTSPAPTRDHGRRRRLHRLDRGT